jgi:pSer/pThr/pTyr-binding forkhead associated (FHA) protein
VAKFVIGRDPGCHLRPASQAISKQHCAIHVRKGQVWVQDFGSTNGTLLNDDPIQGEAQVKDGDSLKIGPLEFRLQIIPTPTPADGTPLPDKLKPLSATAAKPVAIKSAGGVDSDTDDGMIPLPKAGGGDDDAAAMLLGLDDGPAGETASVPEGSTVMELPAFDAAGRPITPKETAKPPAPESANAAGDLLKKYFRRTSG